MNDRAAAAAWFQDAKFGIFIHWGVYSVLGRGEWVMHNDKIPISEYENLRSRFSPQLFSAKEWAEVFRSAGARYVTFTTKHHDGFCMYDSKLTDYKITNTLFGRDVARELADAVRAVGLKVFFYYSLLDWHHPDYFALGRTGQFAGRKEGGDWKTYLEYYIGQVEELCKNYGDIGGLWFDGWWDKPDADWRLNKLYETIHSLQPSAMVGNNHHMTPFPGEDFQMFEQDLPGQNTAGFNTAQPSNLPLETCLTINNSWGYNESDRSFKSEESLVKYLVNANGMGANLLLNVGPLSSGKLQPEQIQKLLAIGRWLATNGEAIYATRKGYAQGDWGVSTARDNKLYVHATNFAGDNLIVDLRGKIPKSVRLLKGRMLEFSASGDTVTTKIPTGSLDTVDTIIEMET